jgi:hypothetical protein
MPPSAKLVSAARSSISPLRRFGTGLHPWAACVIMPLFSWCDLPGAPDKNAIPTRSEWHFFPRITFLALAEQS